MEGICTPPSGGRSLSVRHGNHAVQQREPAVIGVPVADQPVHPSHSPMTTTFHGLEGSFGWEAEDFSLLVPEQGPRRTQRTAHSVAERTAW
ncbi:MAG: hypothetical protein ABSG53_14930 [Thermoguttaceae bacterium]